jgi:hypothetical protein
LVPPIHRGDAPEAIAALHAEGSRMDDVRADVLPAGKRDRALGL